MNRSYYFDSMEEKLAALTVRIGVRGRVNASTENRRWTISGS